LSRGLGDVYKRQDLEQVTFSEPKSPPDIYVNGENGRIKIFDAITGINSYGERLGLSNLTGANSNFINHLASYTEQDELNLAFDYEMQDLVNEFVEKQTLNWVGQESTNQAFKYYFGKSAQHSSSSLSVSIMEAKSGRILASADSNSLFAKDVQTSGDVAYLERLIPEKSNLRWLNHYHNATFWDAPGSVFKIVTALSLEKVKAQCSVPQKVCPLSKNKELFLNSVGEITQNNADTLNRMLRGDANGYYFNKNSCHYPDFDFGKGVKSSYNRNNGIYGQQVHNYSTNRRTCVKPLDSKGQLPIGDHWLTVNLNRSVNTWFAWTHEMITPATFEQGVNHRTHQHKDLLALNASSQIMQKIIPAANVIYQMGFDKSRNLITGEAVINPEGAGNSPKSWILSPVTVKFQDVSDRAALRRFSVGLTGTSMTPLHIAAISASLVNNKVTYPSLINSPIQLENLNTNDRQNTNEVSPESVNINSEKRDFFQDINTNSIIQGMYYAANGSNGSTYTKTFQKGFECAQQRCICMYAKTGTAPLDSGAIDSQNSWITGWFFKNEKNEEGNGFRQCPMNSESFQAIKATVYSFGCAAKRVAINYTGATGCGVVIKNIVKAGLEREIW
ncbi:hypothetical protein MI353_18105, partial [Alteromonas sp. MCA-1]|uniref:penicillin-binding transpeptidase domain-containing protein n=1 Tax=Alteromonas sp. MCA-1 TaxID=2917731 RepID=UPI001EF7C4FE